MSPLHSLAAAQQLNFSVRSGSVASPRKSFSSPTAEGSVASPRKAAHAAFEAVANALERDLEDEKRERRVQVGFLSKSHLEERDIIGHRVEVAERQLVEARALWGDERKLLMEKLQSAEGGGDRALRKAEDAVRSSR